MLLRHILTPLPDNVLDSLEDVGIKTDEELLFGDMIEIWQKLLDGNVSLQEIKDARTLVASQQAAPMVRGDELLREQVHQQETRDNAAIFCGVKALDDLVGGFGQHRLLEISGDKGSGKTMLALQACVQHLAGFPGSGTVWIDTTGDFSIDTVPPGMLSGENANNISTILERLQVSLAFDLDALQEILEALQDSLNIEPNLRCIVIDNVTSLIRPILSITSSQGHSVMVSLMRQLHLFAEAYSLTIIVINSTSMANPRNMDSRFEFTNRKPALGPSFTYMTDATIWLSKADHPHPQPSSTSGDVHTAEILRSRFTPSKTWCPFRICEGALRPFEVLE
ncbi:hypothetical protein QCA50_005849 [Cerrena zonata]|uniref:RecA family profile 1 domain-containing protein n=1 Tax=Cerrena zonata TaxID=2478898 RepID=A0AAW0GBL6_9APHY